MKILLASDAWYPQINGVVRTLNRVREELEAQGHVFEIICPDQFRTFPCPSYPEIPLAILPGLGLVRRIEAVGADAIHIATEGPIGLAVRNYCVKRGLPFTTSYHTRFPEYLSARVPVPGPLDIVDGAGVGALNEDLGLAVGEAIKLPRDTCRENALKYSWTFCAEMFLNNLSPLR